MSRKPKRQSELGAATGSRGSVISPFDIAAKEVALTEQSHEKIYVEQASNVSDTPMSVAPRNRNWCVTPSFLLLLVQSGGAEQDERF